MADQTAGRKQATQTTPATKKPPKKAGAKLDLSTVAGIGLALVGIIGGLVLEKGKIGDVMQSTAALIVMGGTFGAVLVTNPLSVVIRAMQGMTAIFFEPASAAAETIEMLIEFATKARKNGIVSLEAEGSAIAEPFLRKSINLAVDGTDLQELRKMMETDMALGEQSLEAEAKVWESAGGYAPTIGIIGAVMGLIQVMKHLEDIKEVGHGIAVAFVATVYGVASANIFFIPAANKLRTRARQAMLHQEMVLEGVIGIVEGLNPTLIRMKLDSYNRHGPKPKKAKTAAAPAGKPGAAKAKPGGAAPAPAAAGARP
jgi:chemotaxis protein MotA